MPSVNPGPATTQTASQLATMTPVNALGPTVPGQAGDALRATTASDSKLSYNRHH